MSEIMHSLVGLHVIVYSSSGSTDYSDTGVVVAADGNVIVLDASSGRLVFPLSRIRVVKIMD